MSNNDLTDKQIIAMGKKTKPVKKRILFKEYAVTYINLGLASRDNKTMKKELPAIAKRGADLIMKSILKKTRMPTKLPEHEKPFITIIIYAGIMSNIDEVESFVYPPNSPTIRLEEV